MTPLRRTLLSSPLSECASCHQQGHTGSKTLLQQNPPVLHWDASWLVGWLVGSSLTSLFSTNTAILEVTGMLANSGFAV